MGLKLMEVYKMATISERLGLTSGALILIAILSGGDYDVYGTPFFISL